MRLAGSFIGSSSGAGRVRAIVSAHHTLSLRLMNSTHVIVASTLVGVAATGFSTASAQNVRSEQVVLSGASTSFDPAIASSGDLSVLSLIHISEPTRPY